MPPKSENPQKKPPHQKLTEEEKLEKKKEKQRKILRDKFEREIKFNETSIKRNEQTHYELAQNFKSNEVLSELNATTQFANHVLDKTENKIETIKIHREHASEQHLRAQSFQSKLVKNIIDLYNLFQNSLNQMYDAKRKSLVDDFLSENLNRERMLYERKRYYENYAHATVSLMKSRLSNWNESFIEKRFDAEADLVIKTEELNKKKFKFEAKICEEIEEIFRNFSKDWPKDRLDEYQTFFNQDNKIRDENDELKKKILKSENALEKIKKLWKTENAEMSSRIAVLGFEYKSMLILYQSKKRERIEAFNFDYQNLKALINNYRRAKKYLDERLETAVRVAATHKLCNKYEKLEDMMRFHENEADGSLSDEHLNLEGENLLNHGHLTLQKYHTASKRNTCIEKKKLKCREIIEESFLNNPNLKSNRKASEEFQDLKINSEKETSTVVSLFGDREFNINFQNYENIYSHFSQSPNEQIDLSSNHPSLTSQSSSNGIIIAEFFRKLSIVEADCVALRNCKQKLIKDNKDMESLLAKRKYEHGINENMKLLRLNCSPSIGKIGQISHQMPQIHEEILIRNCNAMHLKKFDENKGA